jgi:hypothetical protein
MIAFDEGFGAVNETKITTDLWCVCPAGDLIVVNFIPAQSQSRGELRQDEQIAQHKERTAGRAVRGSRTDLIELLIIYVSALTIRPTNERVDRDRQRER